MKNNTLYEQLKEFRDSNPLGISPYLLCYLNTIADILLYKYTSDSNEKRNKVHK